MQWLNVAKNFLGSIAAEDYDNLNNILDDDVSYNSSVFGKQKVIDHLSRLKKINIKINNTAYNNKLVFLECELGDTVRFTPTVVVVNINDLGKIISIGMYER